MYNNINKFLIIKNRGGLFLDNKSLIIVVKIFVLIIDFVIGFFIILAGTIFSYFIFKFNLPFKEVNLSFDFLDFIFLFKNSFVISDLNLIFISLNFIMLIAIFFNIRRLLKNISKEKFFIPKNFSCIKNIGFVMILFPFPFIFINLFTKNPDEIMNYSKEIFINFDLMFFGIIFFLLGITLKKASFISEKKQEMERKTREENYLSIFK
jgi:hypothetical protein